MQTKVLRGFATKAYRGFTSPDYREEVHEVRSCPHARKRLLQWMEQSLALIPLVFLTASVPASGG